MRCLPTLEYPYVNKQPSDPLTTPSMTSVKLLEHNSVWNIEIKFDFLKYRFS